MSRSTRSSHPRPTQTQAQRHEASDDQSTNPSAAPTLADVLQARCDRRTLLRGALALTALSSLGASPLANRALASSTPPPAPEPLTRFGFSEITRGVDDTHHVAPGYRADLLIRWGDPLWSDAPPFDPNAQQAAAQGRQFGYNNDYIGYIPLPLGSNNSEHGLLCVNHEYTNAEVMFPDADQRTAAHVEIEMACNGGSILEIRKHAGRWRIVPDSPYTRRITALDTEIALSGPVAGHARVRTTADPSGTRVIGTLNNCAGGITPWGTYLMAEENFHSYFSGDLDRPSGPTDARADEGSGAHPEKTNYERYGVPAGFFAWGDFQQRFDVNAEPNEANRFGWIVEVDPLDPSAMPVKRTALGRFKHEGAESIVNTDGRLVLYSGDDQRFEYLYRFVTRNPVDPVNRAANRDLLDDGTLAVARFDEDGTLTWLPLIFGHGGLTPENGFHSQADVLIETRRAADLLGATPMDRPEDVEPDPRTGRIYVMLTNNSRRTPEQIDAANPRAENLWGHLLELTPPQGDHTAARFTWDILVQAGDPQDPNVAAQWHPATSANGWFACPDNCAIDPAGGLWIATDQGRGWATASGGADGLWALETAGPGRGIGRMFFRVPVGAELCGPCFTPDGRSLFLAVQHPGTDGTLDYPGFERLSTFADPATRWPDFDPNMPPRPSVLVITKEDGGPIGG
ncbi:dTDP-glucose 4,6-dehydratase [Thiocapsa imhoffii]|uniref:dTDP-glucose 4,6-dehydratase n=1 Tax=Thiocapsa imhoffii TaxID=382777 RepID=A0A9X0WJ59_9GAMM|nr:PhoX family phosphatase [Thiocapsa imhoffii]MBK1645717.1 dTDP-glucose 4,6-dehydratase [Thiocapsa imhoffii]